MGTLTRDQQSDTFLKLSPYYVDFGLVNEAEWEKFQDRVDALSIPTYNLLVGTDSYNCIVQIMREFSLSFSQGQALARIIRDKLVGLITNDAMAMAIESRLQINSSVVQQIVKSINNKLFSQTSREPSQPTNPNNMLNLREQDNT